MLVLLVGWGAFFAYALVRFRRQRNPRADYAGITGHKSTWVEAGVAVAEAVLLIGFSIPLWADRVERFPAKAASTHVRVVAEQFAWNVHYPGADGAFGRTKPELVDVQTNPLGLDRGDPAAKDDVTTLNHLYLPADQPALIELTSKDVIHSFALQEMRIKQDVVPGTRVPVWFVPKVTTAEMRQRTGNPQLRVRDLLRAALRPRPLPDARLRPHRDEGGLRQVAVRAGVAGCRGRRLAVVQARGAVAGATGTRARVRLRRRMAPTASSSRTSTISAAVIIGTTTDGFSRGCR